MMKRRGLPKNSEGRRADLALLMPKKRYSFLVYCFLLAASIYGLSQECRKNHNIRCMRKWFWINQAVRKPYNLWQPGDKLFFCSQTTRRKCTASVLVQLNIRVIMDISKTRVCFGPTLVCRFNRYWIKTSGGIRVNTWTTIEFWSTAQTNIQTSKALLQNCQHFVDPQESQLQSRTKLVVSCRSKGKDFSIVPADFNS